MRKTLSTIIATLTTGLILVLSARYVTGHWLFHTFASFQIQGAALAFLMAALAFLIYRNLYGFLLVLASVGLAVHGYMMLGSFRQPGLLDPGAKPLFRLMSVNIMGDNPHGKDVADAMIASGADVIFIQESAPIGPEIDRIKQTYPYRLGCGAKTITCDQSLWSKRPFVMAEVKTASPIYRDRLLYASVDFDGRVVTFVNTHFTKPYFDGFLNHEMARVTQFIKPIAGPMILAGDFNSSILSPGVRNFIRANGFMTAEKEPATWPVDFVEAGMAIDHVFVRNDMPLALRFKSLHRLESTLGSNHFGLIADVVLEDQTLTYPPQ
jgi:endonuclease/exonuclease/phosphatase (EEP) superfamily protein YafD